MAERLSSHYRLPVVDGVAAGVAFAVALARLGLQTSKAGGYAAPGPKTYTGLFAPFAPKP
jgi:allantoin racemase